jgi:Holliday junction resolvase RusA-like endonuclease
MMFQFTVNGLPKAQPRTRHGAGGRVYNPKVADGWRALVTLEARKHKPSAPLSGPVKLRVCYYFPRPKDHFTKGGALKASCIEMHTFKPDTDNLQKAAKDVLTEVGYWGDDCQVWSDTAEKFWTVLTPYAIFYIYGI